MLDAKAFTQSICLVTTTAALSLIPLANTHASTTMYNLYGASNSPVAPGFEIDGWLWGENQNSPGNPTASSPGWVGTNGPTNTPFSIIGGMPLNWAGHITKPGDSLIISQTDAFRRYGIYADIDTSSGAWRDPTATNSNGTKHAVDFGLFKSDVTQNIHLSISGIANQNDNFGISIFKGAAQNSSPDHYGYIRFDSSADYFDFSETITTSTTVGNITTTTTTEIDHSLPYVTRTLIDPSSGLTNNSLSFEAEAGQLYTIILGGNNGRLYADFKGYQLSISSVPLPATIWLFASVISGFLGLQHRKKSEK